MLSMAKKLPQMREAGWGKEDGKLKSMNIQSLKEVFSPQWQPTMPSRNQYC